MRRVLTIIALLAGAISCRTQSVGSDIEMWNEVDIITPLPHRATLTVPLVLRDSFTLSNPQLGGVGPILDVSVGQHVVGTLGYLYVAVPHIGPGFNANVPLGALTLRERLRGFEFADRNRVECLYGIPKNPIRYRNKLVIDGPELRKLGRPYVSDEVFYDFSQASWSQNRLQVGVSRLLSERNRLNLFYLERDERRLDPTATHALGVAMEVHLARGMRKRSAVHEEN